MFVKGMKYEIRSVARIVLPMLIVFLCAAMIMSAGFMLDGRLFHFTDKAEEGATVLAVLFTIVEFLLGMGLLLLMVAINLAVYVLIIYRFYVSFFTDEGYLTFTLPVTTDCHLMIKIASMFLWNIVSLIVTALGGLIILGGVAVGYTEEFKLIFSEFPELFELIWMELQRSVDYLGAQIVFGGLALIVTAIFQSLLIYFSIALGCMLFKKHRLLGSILSIFVVNGVYSTISSIGSYILTYFSVMSEIVFLVLMGFVTVLTVVGIIAMYLGMRYILQKKLNLD
jgi:hypothetical protein